MLNLRRKWVLWLTMAVLAAITPSSQVPLSQLLQSEVGCNSIAVDSLTRKHAGYIIRGSGAAIKFATGKCFAPEVIAR
jgi:hypothetical protein